MSLTDAELIVASGDEPELFAGLFDRHYVVIAAFLRRRLDRSLADELAAETFLRAFDGRGGYDPGWGDARPWLFGIATHLLAHHRRVKSGGCEPTPAPDDASIPVPVLMK